MTELNSTAKRLAKIKKFPCAMWIFTRVICAWAPYFGSIHPRFTVMEVGRGEAVVRKRRAVLNHIGTVHAIACANLCELVAGTTLEVTIPPTHRWIPKGMKIRYLAKAETDIVGKTVIAPASWPDADSLNVHVDVFDRNGKIVVDADIEMYVSKKKT